MAFERLEESPRGPRAKTYRVPDAKWNANLVKAIAAN